MGIIERDTLITLIEKKAWYDDVSAKRLTSKFIDGKKTLPEEIMGRTATFIHKYDPYNDKPIDVN